ncbi:hypothetical protein FHG87_010780 [Trinorchestia longiramus]|nr:hypothetical protein FHG87_010780 [Trinorchestia longiramus]
MNYYEDFNIDNLFVHDWCSTRPYSSRRQQQPFTRRGFIREGGCTNSSLLSRGTIKTPFVTSIALYNHNSVSQSGPYRPPGGVEEMQGGGRRVRLGWGEYITV